MNDLERRAVDLIDLEGLLTFLDELVALPSTNGSAAEHAIQEKVAGQMRSWGLEVDAWEIDFDQLRRHPAFSAEVERSRGLGVVGSLGAGRGPTLIFNGHTDVVPAGELDRWRYDPWRATVNHEEGRVYGRGALDMKGGLCCALFAAKALLAAGIELQGKLLIQSVSGEEDGGFGTLAAVIRGHIADAAIVVEPTEMMVAPAQAGALNFRITLPGRAAHGALRYEGVDPLEKFILVYQAIMAYEKSHQARFPDARFDAYPIPYPICVGTIQGGVWASTVAEYLTFEGRLGVAVDEDVAEARQAFARFLAQAASADPWLRENPPVLTWWGGQFAPAGIPTDHPLVQQVSKAFEAAGGGSPVVRGMPYGADMRLLVNEGDTPTVLFGPGDVRKAHQPDEYVPLADLATVTRTLVLTALRFCGVVEPVGVGDLPPAQVDPAKDGPFSGENGEKERTGEESRPENGESIGPSP